MKKYSTHNLMLVAALVALPSLALAQVANATGAVTGAVNAAAQVNRLPVTPPPPPPAISASAAAQGATAAAATVRAPVINPAAASSAAGTQIAAGASTTSGLNANATTHASVTGQTHGLSQAATVGHNASVAVNPAGTISEIKGSAFNTRKELAAEIEGRVDASMKAMAALQAKAEAAGDKSRREFAKALVEVRAREKALRASLKATTQAAGESTWGEVQSALAKNYGDYAQAVASAEAAAQGSASVSEAPKS